MLLIDAPARHGAKTGRSLTLSSSQSISTRLQGQGVHYTYRGRKKFPYGSASFGTLRKLMLTFLKNVSNAYLRILVRSADSEGVIRKISKF